jgi:hypothetical protein
MNRIPQHLPAIQIRGHVAPGLTDRMHFLLRVRRLRSLTAAERDELQRLLGLARLGQNGGDRHAQ